MYRSRTSSNIDEEYLSQNRIQQEWKATHTNSGTPLNTLAYLTDLPLHDSRTAKVYWEKESNRFLLCPVDGWDFEIERTQQSLRAFALMLAFDPKEWGCRRCGCTAEYRDDEFVCWCDTCVEGCDTPDTLDMPPPAPPRKLSPFFARRLLPPPMGPLMRQTAIAGSADIPLENMRVSPLSPMLDAVQLSAEDMTRFTLQ